MLPVNDFICVKLGETTTSSGEAVDGERTMQIYETYLWGHSSVWFSTNALSTGMAKAQVKHYRTLLKDQEVRVLFAYHNGVDSDIRYSAKVLDIVSSKEPVGSPDPIMMPDEYRGEQKRIWIQIADLRREEKLSARAFQITSTGRSLKEVMETSQFCFGYVSYQ